MKPERLDVILIIFVVFFIVTDIVLALGLCLIMPNYLIRFDYYAPYDQKLPFDEAAQICNCLYAVFQNGTDELISFKKVGPKPAVLEMTTEPKTTTTTTTTEPASTTTLKPEDPYVRHLRLAPFLVSVHQKIKKSKNMKFVCAGFIMNAKELLISDYCFPGKLEIMYEDFKIRSQSPYWWQGGKMHEVAWVTNAASEKSIIYFRQKLYKIRVKPHFAQPVVPSPLGNFTIFGNEVWFLNTYEVGWPNLVDKTPFYLHKWKPKFVNTTQVPKACSTYSKKSNLSSFYVANCNFVINMNMSAQEFCTKMKVTRIETNFNEKLTCNKK